VWVGPHVEALPAAHFDGTHLVEENERADHAARGRWEQAAHGEAAAEIAFAALDLELDGRLVRLGTFGLGVRHEAHASLITAPTGESSAEFWHNEGPLAATFQPSDRRLLAAILLVAVALRVAWVGRPLDHRLAASWRQADSFQIARNFAREDARIFYPRIDWRADTPGFVEMELPLLPWAGGMLFRVFGEHAQILRMLSCLLEIGSLLLFTSLAYRLLPATAALAAVALFAINPLLIYLATALQPEPLMLFFAMASVVLLERWNERGNDAFLLAAAAALGGAILAKAPAASLAILFIWVVLRREGISAPARPQLWLAAAIALVPPLAWYAWAKHFYVLYGNSLGLSNEYPFLGLDMLWPPHFAVGLIKLEAVFVLTPVAWLLVAASLGAWPSIERPLVWLASAWILLIVAARTTADDWAFYYHSLAVAPACLLIGAGYAVVARRRPLFSALLLAATVASVLGTSVSLVRVRDERPGLEAMRRCGLELAREIAPEQTIVVRGGRVHEDGWPVAHNESMMFAWLDRRGFTYGDEELSIARLQDIAARGGRYWIASPKEMAILGDHAQAHFREIGRCGDGYVLFDLTPPDHV
jgi:hypothetical protein